jgi:hypothetical protein
VTAAWQVGFYIVPRNALTTAARPSQATWDDTDWWRTSVVPADYRRRLDGVAARGQSKDPDVEIWGREDGNRVDVRSAGGAVRSVQASVDVRRLDSKFGAALIAFVRAIGAVLIRRDGVVVEPNIGAYAAALRTSAAWQFASDPAASFASYASRDEDDD